MKNRRVDQFISYCLILIKNITLKTLDEIKAFLVRGVARAFCILFLINN